MQATSFLIGSWNMTWSILSFHPCVYVQLIHKTYEFCHLDELLEIHAWELGGDSIFVGTTSYLNHWSEKDLKPHALGLSADKIRSTWFFFTLSEQLSCGTEHQNNKSSFQNWKLIGDFISCYSLKCVWTIEVVIACFCPNGIRCIDLSSITLLVTFQRTYRAQILWNTRICSRTWVF
jgi:hypothetical protein